MGQAWAARLLLRRPERSPSRCNASNVDGPLSIASPPSASKNGTQSQKPSPTCEASFFPPNGRQEERMIGAYSRTGRTHAQARQPELGASHPGPCRPRHRVRAAGEEPAALAGHVCRVARAPHLVREEQEPRLRSRVVAPGVGHRPGRDLRRHRLTAGTRCRLDPDPARVPAIRGSLRPQVVGYFGIGLLKRM